MKAALDAIRTALLIFLIVGVATFFIDRAVFGVNAPGLFS